MLRGSELARINPEHSFWQRGHMTYTNRVDCLASASRHPRQKVCPHVKIRGSLNFTKQTEQFRLDITYKDALGNIVSIYYIQFLFLCFCL